MKKSSDGISRRQFLTGSLGALALGLASGTLQGQERKPDPTGRTRCVLLGTGGGPRPNKLRSQPAVVIQVDNVPYVVDCGEGVARQMVFAGVPLRDIRYIFLTHQHSDHNLDYGNLIYDAWVSGFKGQIDTYGPPPLGKMTRLFMEMNQYDIDIRIPDEGRPPLAPMVRPHEITGDGVVVQDERVKVTACLVNHPPVKPAFAFRFDTPDRSIVISGDTTPWPALVKLAQGADTLIHEVIHKPSLARLMARIPNADRLLEHIVASHTTHVDVGKVAREAGVKTLVLTHFVPSDDPSVTDEDWLEGARAQFKGKAIAGKDLMEV